MTITLDGSEQRFDCYVRFVDGALTVLGQLGGVAPELNGMLTPGSLGYLISNEDGVRVALRGIATTAPDGARGLAFVVINADSLPDRRGAPRTPLATTARVRSLGADGGAEGAQIETIAVDVEPRRRADRGPSRGSS